MSTAIQLASVRAAIARIEATGVIEYSAGSERTRMTELTALYARERELLARQACEGSPLLRPVYPVDI